MKIAIFENNREDIDTLLDLLKMLQKQVEIHFEILVLLNYEMLIKFIEDIDLLFLDVELNGVNGIDVGRIIRSKDHDCKIIIVSAYQKYLIDGYKIRAERYFMKPINEKEFLLEMKIVLNEYVYREYGFVDEKISREKIIVHKIMYIEFEYRNTVLYCEGNKRYESRYPLKYWIEKFSDYDFVQCYKSIIVNCRYIQKIERVDILLSNGNKIPVSRHYKKDVGEAYVKCLEKQV